MGILDDEMKWLIFRLWFLWGSLLQGTLLLLDNDMLVILPHTIEPYHVIFPEW